MSFEDNEKTPSELKVEEPSHFENGDETIDDHDVTPTAEELKAEKRLRWKIDLLILPLASIIYFLATVDRADLGNAKIAGMSEELKLTAQDFSDAANTFLVGYIFFQLPGTLLIKQIGAPLQFGLSLTLWGVCTASTVAIKTRAQLLAMRFLIGTCEAFIQGLVFYLSFWYEYSELTTRGAIFFSTSTLAGSFNGLVSYAISKNLNGHNGWLAWRWIFLVDGVIPIGVGLIIIALMPSSPSKAARWMFTDKEKEIAIRRSRRSHNTSEARFEWKKVPLVLLSFHFWLIALIGMASHFCLSSLTNFLPTIIVGFGYSTVRAQLFTVIVYACAFVGILFWGRVSDYTGARAYTFAASTVGSVLGYALLVGATNNHLRFAATCITAFSIYPSIVLTLSWASMTFVGYTRRGAAVAFYNIFSQIFAIAGNQAYDTPPYYRKGQSISLGLMAMMLVVTFILRWYLDFRNKQKDNMSPEKAAELRNKSLEEIGDHHPDYRYIL